MTRYLLPLATVSAILLAPADVQAQAAAGSPGGVRPDARGAPSADTAGPPAAGALRLVRVAKWSTLAGATAAGVWGFVENARADDRFTELERLCEARRVECLRRRADGAYEDAALESLYQTVRRHDRHAHLALVAGQVGVAASVVLFLLDLGNVEPPDDIPWVPRQVRLESGPGGVRLSVGLPLGRPGG